MEFVESVVAARREASGGATCAGPDEPGPQSQPDEVGFPYASHYCEENVYLLIHELQSRHLREGAQVFAVFLSSTSKATPIWRQKLGDPVCWDYHVVACVRQRGDAVILDFDSQLGFATEAREYVLQSLRPELDLAPRHQQRLRVVEGSLFLAHFASDRSHMRDSAQASPPWPCIRGALAGAGMNLMDFVDVAQDGRDGVPGCVMAPIEFLSWLREEQPGTETEAGVGN